MRPLWVSVGTAGRAQRAVSGPIGQVGVASLASSSLTFHLLKAHSETEL